MMDFDRGDVATALFPFTEISIRKPRPVLVLSHQNFNRRNNHVIAAMITTGSRSSWPDDHAIVDLASTGLTHRSIVRWKVFTLPFTVLGRRIGLLASADRDAVTAKLAGLLID